MLRWGHIWGTGPSGQQRLRGTLWGLLGPLGHKSSRLRRHRGVVSTQRAFTEHLLCMAQRANAAENKRSSSCLPSTAPTLGPARHPQPLDLTPTPVTCSGDPLPRTPRPFTSDPPGWLRGPSFTKYSTPFLHSTPHHRRGGDRSPSRRGTAQGFPDTATWWSGPGVVARTEF